MAKELRFLADRMVGKLAKWLRILNFDTLYFNQVEPGELIKLARRENRLILTRNSRLRKEKIAKICLLAANDSMEQLKEVVEKLDLKIEISRLFKRCLICNQELEEISSQEVEGKIPPHIFITQKDFFSCPNCKRVFWRGSHPQRMLQRLQKVLPFTSPNSSF